ncbi:DUF7224 domain-containing protein [Streptomyces sp. NRRL S-118]|uniref:DUF7224 domain-containing protein n=1 Tax=Streptomyces sp. NRRL S-118 TaxID=1463881 RepID=UPI0004CC4A79|nr:hypothetical protein [Streptomyces sp. NRRL S-118]
MRLRTLVRSSSATVLLPLLIGFILLALGDDLTAWVTPHYWTSVTGSAAFALPFVAAACAGSAAWEGARLAKGQVFGHAPVRNPVAITLPLLLPVVAAGLLGILAALVTAAVAADVSFGLPQPGILAAVAAVLIANALVGSIIGRIMPGVLAAPLALIGSFVATAYPASWNVPWLRHLVGGGLSSCCSVDTSIDGRALLGTIVFTAGISAAALILIRFRGSVIPLTVAGVCFAGSLTGAWLLVRDLGSEAVQGRATSELACENTGRHQICLWPEVENAAQVRQDTSTAAEKLEQAGVPVPHTLTMAARPQPGAAKLGIAPDARPEEIPAGIASGLLPQPPTCALNGRPYPAGDAAVLMEAWLQTTAGTSMHTVKARFDPETVRLLQKLRALSPKQQLAWYERNHHAMSACDTKPQLNIPESRG